MNAARNVCLRMARRFRDQDKAMTDNFLGTLHSAFLRNETDNISNTGRGEFQVLEDFIAISEEIILVTTKNRGFAPAQRQIYHSALLSALPCILGSECYMANVKKIHSIIRASSLWCDKTYDDDDDQGIDQDAIVSRNMIVCIQMVRQVGKSFSMRIFCACLILAVPGIEILHVANTQKLCIENLEGIKGVLTMHLGEDVYTQRSAINNQFKLQFLHGEHESSLIQGVTGIEGSIRGRSPNFMWIDESSWMNFGVISRGLFPLMQVNGRSMVMTTTRNIANVEHTALMEQRENIRCINISMVCKACVSKGPEASSKCLHRAYLAPHWHGQVRSETIVNILSTVDPVAHQQELRNTGGSGGRVFSDEKLRHLRYITRKDIVLSPTFVVIGVDPDSSGEAKFAFVALARDRVSKTVCVIGMSVGEANLNEAKDRFEFIKRFIDRLLLSYPSIRNIITAVESNLGIDGVIHITSCITRACRLARVSHWTVIHVPRHFERDSHPATPEATNTFLGTKQTMARNKGAYVNRAAKMMGEGTLSAAVPVSCVCAGDSDEPMKSRALHASFMSELKRFKCVVNKYTYRRSYSGKAMGLGDDMTMAWIIALYHFVEILDTKQEVGFLTHNSRGIDLKCLC